MLSRPPPTETFPLYMILLTIRGGKANIVQGLEAGADDYITSPSTKRSSKRVQVGARVVHLQMELAERVKNSNPPWRT